MIHKNINYGGINAHTVLEFGKGTILLVNAANDGHVAVLYKTDVPRPIGNVDPSTVGSSSDNFEPEVIMVFDKVESIDVVINSLKKAKKRLIGTLNR